MKNFIYQYSDYKKYLRAYITAKPNNGRGMQAVFAEAIHSPVSHISQVLNGESHLSMEQTENLNIFLNHDDEEADFLLLLVQLARAGSQALKNRLKLQVKKQSEKFFNIKNRIDVVRSVSEQDQAEFYSSWLYGAVHILLTIPKYQTVESISKYLSITPAKTQKILNFLAEIGLAKRLSMNSYEIGSSRIHLAGDSPLISKFHTNWRMKAITAFDNANSHEDLHYSSVVSVSEEDYIKLKNLMIESIQDIKAIIHPSEAEGLHCFNMDFFRL